jgi:hypothetical protein
MQRTTEHASAAIFAVTAVIQNVNKIAHPQQTKAAMINFGRLLFRKIYSVNLSASRNAFLSSLDFPNNSGELLRRGRFVIISNFVSAAVRCYSNSSLRTKVTINTVY